MPAKRTLLKWVAAGILIGHVLSRDAYAYLDPGTGSYVLQVLVASFVAGAFAVKTFWAAIRDFVVRLFSPRNEDGDKPK